MEDRTSFFCLAASLRSDSLNEQLLKVVARQIDEREKTDVDVAKLNEFPLPLYDADIQHQQGLPEQAHRLRDAIVAAGNVVVATPEYNHSIAGPLKNAIDWISRFRPNPWSETRVLLLSAAPSRVGGLRGLEQTRIPLQALGAHVYPRLFGLGDARRILDDGTVTDDEVRGDLHRVVDDFVDHVRLFDREETTDS